MDEEFVIDPIIVDEPIIDESIIDEPIIDEPIIDEPIIDEPIIDEPIIDEPTIIINEPIIDEITLDNPDNEPVEAKILARLEILEQKPAYPAGENIAQYRVVAVRNNLSFLASNKKPDGYLIGGLALANAETSALLALQTEGYLQESSWNWQVDKPLYLGEDGTIIQIPDFSALFVLSLGRVLSPTEIIINIGDPVWLD